jgi:hypothetical protein
MPIMSNGFFCAFSAEYPAFSALGAALVVKNDQAKGDVEG